MKISKQAQKIISFIENPKMPFLYYILTFFSCITLRNFLEIFSDRAKISFKFFPCQQPIFYYAWKGLSVSLLHYYVFWVALFLAIAILFFIITKESIVIVLKAILGFSFVINITPIFDLILSSGRGFNISYVYPRHFLDFLPIPKSLTPGMILTSIIALVLSFIYCKIKTQGLIKAALGSLSVYGLLMLTSLLPLILRASHPVPIIRVLLISIFIELLIIYSIWNWVYCLALSRDCRILRILHFYLIFILGMALAAQPILPVITKGFTAFLLTVIATFLAWIAAVIFNNIEDYSIDKISNNQRPLVLKKIPADDYRKTGLAIAFLAAIFGLGVNFQTFFFTLLLMGNSFIYSLPPLRFKRVPILSKLGSSSNSLIVAMLGYVFAGGELLRFPSVISWYFLIFITLSMNFIDIKDYEGDKKEGILTLPVLLGLGKAKLLIAGFFLVSYCVLRWVLLEPMLFIPGAIIGCFLFFLINKKTYREDLILIVYLVSMLILIIYLQFFPVRFAGLNI